MDDFNKELNEIKKLAGLGQGIYDNPTPPKKTQGVGDGLTTGYSSDAVSEEVEENTYSNKNVTDVDACEYFPSGDHNDVSDEAGPASAKQGDNPLQKKIKESYKSFLGELQKHYSILKESSESEKQACSSCGSKNCTLEGSDLKCDDCGCLIESSTDFSDDIYSDNTEYDTDKITSYNTELIEEHGKSLPDSVYDMELSDEQICKVITDCCTDETYCEACCDVVLSAIRSVTNSREIGTTDSAAEQVIELFNSGNYADACDPQVTGFRD